MGIEDPLAVRLRALRTRGLGTPVTQQLWGSVIKVSSPTISSWETGKVVPAQERLEAYARFFATPRSIQAERLLGDDELTPDERERREGLLGELLALRPDDPVESADRPADEPDFWHFPDGGPVRIICGELSADDQPPIASGRHRNYVALSGYADLDSLVELFGHVRSRNPASDVRYTRPRWLTDDDMHAHLVLLGNMARMQARIANWLPALPVRQVSDTAVNDGEMFVVGGPGSVGRYGPVPAPADSDLEYTEDVGFLSRLGSPLDSERTLTICSGVFTRGVYGAVRSLTDHNVSAVNNAYLRSRFGNTNRYGVLMRVHFSEYLTSTPRLDDGRVRLFEFS